MRRGPTLLNSARINNSYRDLWHQEHESDWMNAIGWIWLDGAIQSASTWSRALNTSTNGEFRLCRSPLATCSSCWIDGARVEYSRSGRNLWHPWHPWHPVAHWITFLVPSGFLIASKTRPSVSLSFSKKASDVWHAGHPWHPLVFVLPQSPLFLLAPTLTRVPHFSVASRCLASQTSLASVASVASLSFCFASESPLPSRTDVDSSAAFFRGFTMSGIPDIPGIRGIRGIPEFLFSFRGSSSFLHQHGFECRIRPAILFVASGCLASLESPASHCRWKMPKLWAVWGVSTDCVWVGLEPLSFLSCFSASGLPGMPGIASIAGIPSTRAAGVLHGFDGRDWNRRLLGHNFSSSSTGMLYLPGIPAASLRHPCGIPAASLRHCPSCNESKAASTARTLVVVRFRWLPKKRKEPESFFFCFSVFFFDCSLFCRIVDRVDKKKEQNRFSFRQLGSFFFPLIFSVSSSCRNQRCQILLCFFLCFKGKFNEIFWLQHWLSLVVSLNAF